MEESLRCDSGAGTEVVISALKKKKEKMKGTTNCLCLLRNKSARRPESSRPHCLMGLTGLGSTPLQQDASLV